WVTIATFFLGWQALAVYNAAHQVFNPVFLPSPAMVLGAGRDLLRAGVLYLHILQSAWRLLIGFSLGTVAAVLVGILVGRSRRLESIVAPLSGVRCQPGAFILGPGGGGADRRRRGAGVSDYRLAQFLPHGEHVPGRFADRRGVHAV